MIRCTPDRARISDIIRTDAYQGGVIDMGAGHVHPLAYALGLARAAQAAGAQIYENSLVTDIQQGAHVRVRTASGHIDAGHVLLAANGYLGGLAPQVAARVMPINNFIVATAPLPQGMVLTRDVAVADSKFVINYFRMSRDRRLLFGGGESYGYRFPDILKTVRKPMLEVFPQLKDTDIAYAWGARWPSRSTACRISRGWPRTSCQRQAIRAQVSAWRHWQAASWPTPLRGNRNVSI